MTAITNEQTKYLERLLATGSTGNLRVFDRGEITEGWETQIHAFAARYEVDGQERSRELILRLFPGASGAGQAVKEFGVMERVGRWGVPTPRVDFVVTEKTPFGDPFIVMERVKGQSMADALEGAPEREGVRIVEAMVDPLVRLHEMPVTETFSWPGTTTEEEAVTFVSPDLGDMRMAVDQSGLHDFEPLLEWLEMGREEAGPGDIRFLHNDYHPLNIMVREDSGELIILDWSFAGLGDFRLDLAWSALLLGVTAGQRYRDVFIQRYEDISGRSAENFSYFEVLKLGARLITIALWLDEDAVIPIPKITKQSIRNQYKVHVLDVYDRVKEVTGLQVPLFEGL